MLLMWSLPLLRLRLEGFGADTENDDGDDDDDAVNDPPARP